MKKVGTALLEIRKKKNIQRKAVAMDFKITSEAVRCFENTHMPKDETLQKLCEYYKVPVSAVWVHMVDESDIPSGQLRAFREIKNHLTGLK